MGYVFTSAELATAMSYLTDVQGAERAVLPQFAPRGASPAYLATTLAPGDRMLLIIELLRTRRDAEPTPNDMDQLLHEAAQILNRTCSHHPTGAHNTTHYWPDITIAATEHI